MLIDCRGVVGFLPPLEGWASALLRCETEQNRVWTAQRDRQNSTAAELCGRNAVGHSDSRRQCPPHCDCPRTVRIRTATTPHHSHTCTATALANQTT